MGVVFGIWDERGDWCRGVGVLIFYSILRVLVLNLFRFKKVVMIEIGIKVKI